MKVHDPSLDAARALLPPTAGYGALIVLPIAFLASLIASTLTTQVALRPWRSPPGAPWWEHARRTYVGRVASMALLVAIPAVLAIDLAKSVGPLTVVRGDLVVQAVTVVAFAAAVPARILAERAALRRPFGPGRWLLGMAVHLVRVRFLLPLLLLVLMVDVRVGLPPVLAAVVAIAVGVLLRWLIVKLLGIVRPAPQRLVAMVAARAAAMGVSPPSVFEVRWPVVNAYAFRSSKQGLIGFTTDAIELLTDDELDALAAHELAHLAEGATVWRVRRAVAWIPEIGLIGIAALYQYSDTQAVASGIVGLALMTTVFKPRFVRHFEKRADGLAKVAEDNPGAYASALARMHEANMVPLVLSEKGTHGHPHDRIADAGGKVPSRPRAASGTVAAVATVAGAVLAILLARRMRAAVTPACAPHDDAACVRAAVLEGGSLRTMLGLGAERMESDPDGALVFYRAAVAANTESPYVPMAAARACVEAGRCAEARRMMKEAKIRSALSHSYPYLTELQGEVDRCE